MLSSTARRSASPALPAGIAASARDGAIFETRADALATWAAKLAALGSPLAALFIDYGHVQPPRGDTLQAVRAHRYDDPLAAPGEADLTAQVDFAAVADAMHAAAFSATGQSTQASSSARSASPSAPRASWPPTPQRPAKSKRPSRA